MNGYSSRLRLKIKNIVLVALVMLGFHFPFKSWSFENKNISVVIDDRIFANNLEYVGDVAKYEMGQTYFGNLWSSYFSVEFAQKQRFNAGLFMKMPFGSSDIIDLLLPLINLEASFMNEKLKLYAGTFATNHNFENAIINSNLFYTRPLELGLKLTSSFENWGHQMWINWQRMESEKANEKFDVGFAGALKWKGFASQLQAHIEHSGGQLFENKDKVSDDLSSALGLSYTKNIPHLNHITLSINQFFSVFRLRRPRSDLTSGRGIEGKIALSPLNFDFYLSLFQGHNYFHDSGEKFYQAEKYLQLGLGRIFHPYKELDISLDVRLKFVDGSFTHTEGVLVSWKYDMPILKR